MKNFHLNVNHPKKVMWEKINDDVIKINDVIKKILM